MRRSTGWYAPPLRRGVLRRRHQASGTAPARTRTRSRLRFPAFRSASARAIRIVSSDFSLTLCAFSVLSARILNATSGSGTSRPTIVCAPSFSHRLQAMIAVRRPVLVVVANEHDRIEEAADLLDDGHQPLDVRL